MSKQTAESNIAEGNKEYASGMIGTPEAYERGYSCGLNGANDYNCSFRIFSTPENTKAWEEGKKDGENRKTKSHD